MNNTAIIVKITNVEKHPNADSLQIVKLFGTQCITGMDTKVGNLMIYFDSNLKLSPEYLKYNNLYRHAELNEDTTKIGYFENNGRVKAIKLRGEFSDGVLMPLESLKYAVPNGTSFKEGSEFNELFGNKICEKYITPVKTPGVPGSRKNRGRKSHPTSPMFVEHWDTSQFMRSQKDIPSNTIVYIEEKEHGTSNRTAKVLVKKEFSRIGKWLRKFLFGIEDISTWKVLNGTRRTIIRELGTKGFHDNTMRDDLLQKVEPYLVKGEEIYTEIVGFEKSGGHIQKGFPYGCKVGENDVLLYRVTMNNVDAQVVDYSREKVYRRAEELGLRAPSLLAKFHYSGTNYSKKKLKELVIELAQGQSVIDPNTLREGVVVWFINHHGNWQALKYKSDKFRAFESKQKDDGVIDIEDQN